MSILREGTECQHTEESYVVRFHVQGRGPGLLGGSLYGKVAR